jgi:hypothetical protein
MIVICQLGPAHKQTQHHSKQQKHFTRTGCSELCHACCRPNSWCLLRYGMSVPVGCLGAQHNSPLLHVSLRRAAA